MKWVSSVLLVHFCLEIVIVHYDCELGELAVSLRVGLHLVAFAETVAVAASPWRSELLCLMGLVTLGSVCHLMRYAYSTQQLCSCSADSAT